MGAFLQNVDTGDLLAFDVVVTEQPSFPTSITEHVVEKGADVADNIRVGLKSLTLEVFVSNEPINQANQWMTGAQSPAEFDVSDTPQDRKSAFGPILTNKTWFTLPIGVPIVNMLVAHEQDIPFKPNVGLDPTQGFTVKPQVLQFDDFTDAVQKTHDYLDLLRSGPSLVTVYGTKGTYDNMAIESFSMTRNADTGTGATFTIQLKEIRIVTTKTVNAPKPTAARGNTPKAKGGQATADAEPQKVSVLLKLLQTAGLASIGGLPSL